MHGCRQSDLIRQKEDSSVRNMKQESPSRVRGSHTFIKSPEVSKWMLLVVIAIALVCDSTVEGFVIGQRLGNEPSGYKCWHAGTLAAASNGGEKDSFDDFGEEDLEGPGVMLEDLNWRVEKLRLEEANTRRFLKAKPRFLPYDECAKWVQAFGRWRTKEDW